MTTERRRSRAGARWGWLLTTLALGVALGVASWANYRSVQDAVATIDLGQIGVFEGIVSNAFRGFGPGESLPELDSLVAAHAEAGLRFIGLVSAEEGLTVLGGTPLPDPVDLPRFDRGPRPARIGDRIRVFFPAPRFRGRGSPGAQAGPEPDARSEQDIRPEQDARSEQDTRAEQGVRAEPDLRSDRRDRPDSRDPTAIMVEFEPLVAGQLMARSIRSLVLGAVAAVLLMFTAVLFWRATLRREAEERTMEEQRRLSTLGELSAVLAHEIRNPLTSLKGHAQLLVEDTPHDAPGRRRVERIVAEAHRLEGLTTDLLDFVRTGPLDLAPVAIEDFLRGVVSAADGGAVTLDAARAPHRWLLDAQRMRQVLLNLLENAVEVSPEGASIEVTAWTEDSSLIITIRDHGEGIAEENLDRIFEPFFTTSAKGTGLGLAVARRIVELHGGTLTARSVPDGGAEFSVALMERKS